MESVNVPIDEPSKFGLKLRLNHVFPLQSKQIISPSAKQVFEFMPLTGRYLKYYLQKKFNGKRPIMDYINLVSAQRMYGCPIGGIGGGTIGRGFKGEFCRFQLYPGVYDYIIQPECQFIVNIRDVQNNTIFQSVLSSYEKPKKAPSSWEWNLDGADCEYTALYPRAWTTYNLSKYGIKLICRQVSPVIPHNYKDSCMPCAVFVWTVENVCQEQRTVSITFTWAEVLTTKQKATWKMEIERYSEEHTCGVTLEQKVYDVPCTFTIAKTKQTNETIHENYCMFNVAKNSDYVWDCLQKNGTLVPDNSSCGVSPKPSDEKNKKAEVNLNYRCDGIGLSSVLTVDPGSHDVTEFCLAWDMPTIQYRKDGKQYKRFYTKYFGSDGIAGASIASYALRNYKRWEKQLTEWQNPILSNSNIPDWLKSALMNELYFVADGGTVWFDASNEYSETDPRHHFGLFGYLEGHEYRMYNTYDVHFYASFALAQLWPNLQVVIQYMFRDTIKMEVQQTRKMLYDGKIVKCKIKDSIPHDLGEPYGEPFTKINAYNIHDVSEWRDLNTKFILQVMRDYQLLKGHSAPFDNARYHSLDFIDDINDGLENELYVRSTHLSSSTIENTVNNSPPIPVNNLQCNGNHIPKPHPVGNILEMLYRNEEQYAEDLSTKGDGDYSEGNGAGAGTWDAHTYLADMYEACVSLVRHMRSWDQDNDGLIENRGCPDMTYDAWVMTGPSAYCGGLWTASLCAVKTMSRLLGHVEEEREFEEMLARAQDSFHQKLWTGTHFKFDTKHSNRHVVMSDQLAGLWFLRSSGIRDRVFNEENVKKALRTIYDNNVLKFCDGKMGAVNGYVLGENNQAGHIDNTALQSKEMWTGVTYGLAALMIYEGMYDEAFKTAGELYSTLTKMGLSFETPEALYENGNHRSIAYMRPLSIWSMYQALISRAPPVKNSTNGDLQKTNENQL